MRFRQQLLFSVTFMLDAVFVVCTALVCDALAFPFDVLLYACLLTMLSWRTWTAFQYVHEQYLCERLVRADQYIRHRETFFLIQYVMFFVVCCILYNGNTSLAFGARFSLCVAMSVVVLLYHGTAIYGRAAQDSARRLFLHRRQRRQQRRRRAEASHGIPFAVHAARTMDSRPIQNGERILSVEELDVTAEDIVDDSSSDSDDDHDIESGNGSTSSCDSDSSSDGEFDDDRSRLSMSSEETIYNVPPRRVALNKQRRRVSSGPPRKPSTQSKVPLHSVPLS